MLAVVDTGPLYTVVDADDDDHVRCRAVLEQAGHRLIGSGTTVGPSHLDSLPNRTIILV